MDRLLDTSKLAIVYLRQSTPGQIRDNVVATQEQYRLREIPARAGFPAERIVVVDDDLGVSGRTIAGRKGMLRVLELLEGGGVACVVVREIGRLTRDDFNTDIGLIARACFEAGAVIITRDRTYDPADQSDRIILGFEGLLAGWDRANIMRRLEHHRRAKQARGVNINGAVPAGYDRVLDVPKADPRHGKLCITRDADVRERIGLILRKGLELGGVLAVVRYLRDASLCVPVMRGTPRKIEWVAANRDRVTRILKNPSYAGAIVNGRRVIVKDRVTGGVRWETRRGYDLCLVIRDAHEAYITWEEHLQMLACIGRNMQAKGFSSGAALLSGLGLLRCGVCGAPLSVQYNAPTRVQRGRVTSNTPYYYACTRRPGSCQNPAGQFIDAAMAPIIVAELEALDLDGLEDLNRNRTRRIEEESRRRQQRVDVLARRAEMLEGAVAEAGRADARTRLVKRFETALADLEAARRAAATPVPEVPVIEPAVVARLETLRVPQAAWKRLTLASRKEIIRALVAAVTVHPDLDGYFVVVDWRGGGRAAAKVKTMRRRKVYPVPEEVLTLFEDPSALGSMAARSGRARLGARA